MLQYLREWEWNLARRKENAAVDMQVEAFIELLDKLGIEKVFVNRYGNQLGIHGIEYIYRQISQSAGIKLHSTPHYLRHTFATRAIECGMDVKTLCEILGHKNATVTLNRYAHSLMEHKAEMMNRIGKLL